MSVSMSVAATSPSLHVSCIIVSVLDVHALLSWLQGEPSLYLCCFHVMKY